MSASKKHKPAKPPATFAFQLLAAMLAASMLPLLLLSMSAAHTLRTHMQEMSDVTSQTTERVYLQMYDSNIEEQAESIDSEMRNVEDAVLVAKSYAEALFAGGDGEKIEPLEFDYDAALGRYVERNPDGKGVVSILSPRSVQPTESQARDFALIRSLFPIFESVIARNSNIVLMYYIHPDDGSYYYPEYEGPEPPLNPVQIRNLTTYSFYTDALQVPPGVRQVAWTSPYLDITPRGWMFTATTPVYDERGVLKGIVAADVTIDRFVGNVLDRTFQDDNGYAFLLDRQFELIAAQRQGLAELGTLNLAELFGGEAPNRYRSMTLNGEAKAVFSRYIPSTDWILGYIVPERKMLEPISIAARSASRQAQEELVFQLAVLFAFAAAVCVAVSFYLRSRVTRPVKLLMRAFSEAREGVFTERLQDTRSYEFNRLLLSFNEMNQQIRELLDEQTALNQRLEDIVERRTVQLRDTNEELERRIEELLRVEQWRKSLFMNISHDLKTPITLIQGYIEAIRDGTIPAENIGLFLDRIHEGIRTITKFIRNLTDLSLLENREAVVNFASFEASAFAADAASRWRDYFGLGQRPFAAKLDDERIYVQGDPYLLTRAVDNLIDNAAKYSDESAPIAFEFERAERELRFRVIDEGEGIPEEAMPYIFQSFYRVDRSRNSHVPGSGLGLSIAKEIAAIHGGDLTVAANPAGRGSVFTLSLPAPPPK